MLREMIEDNISEVGPVMDDYDGGQVAAFDKVLKDIDVYQAIIKHSTSYSGQNEPGMDY
mgnify:CR=1 FL=1